MVNKARGTIIQSINLGFLKERNFIEKQPLYKTGSAGTKNFKLFNDFYYIHDKKSRNLVLPVNNPFSRKFLFVEFGNRTKSSFI